jgi:hypothetical protein
MAGTITTRELTPGTQVLMEDTVVTIALSSPIPGGGGDWLVEFTEPWEGSISVVIGVAEVNEDIWDLA